MRKAYVNEVQKKQTLRGQCIRKLSSVLRVTPAPSCDLAYSISPDMMDSARNEYGLESVGYRKLPERGSATGLSAG